MTMYLSLYHFSALQIFSALTGANCSYANGVHGTGCIRINEIDTIMHTAKILSDYVNDIIHKLSITSSNLDIGKLIQSCFILKRLATYVLQY